jgi:formylglycine-generating enzyme required for sulfatase activity/tRNA A-37 threonylcarbamoyl transferase component Bud32
VARDEEVGREVALKLMRPDRSDDRPGRARFLLEAEITGGLEHPGVVPVYGIGSHDDGRPYYAMRFIRGVSLREAVSTFHASTAVGGDSGSRSLELRKLLDRFLDVCDAIAYAHSRGVIHRDIKPRNIMLGPFGETLVVDWGLAKMVDRIEDLMVLGETTLMPESGSRLEATRSGQRMGTPAYMSPEQAAGRLKDVGPRSDVYSLGATLYNILTGKPPVSDTDLLSMLHRVERGDFEPPRKVAPWVDRALEAVCLKAMSTRPEDRYSSPRALAEDIKKWMADEPVSAWREPTSRRLWRWAKRRQTLVTSTAVGAILALTVLGYLGYEERLRQGRRMTAALARVDALGTAQTQALPMIVRQLAPDVELVRDRLERMAAGEGSNRDGRRRLPGALALLGVDPGQADFLTSFVLSGEPGPAEVLVVRAALAEVGHEVSTEPFRRTLETTPAELNDVQLRGAGVLAGLDTAAAARTDLAAPLARKLVTENPLLLGTWSEVFQPVSRGLIDPLLEIYADMSRPEPRDRTFRLLLEFIDRPENASRAEDLASLLADADPDRARLVIQRLEGPLERARAVTALAPLLEDVARYDTPKAARQGRIATALILLGEAGRVWPLFVQRDDPSVRTELVHNLVPYGVKASKVVGRLKTESDTSARRALLLCLGGFPLDQLTDSDRQALTADLLERYRVDPDPGMHAAISWLLRTRWGLAKEVAAADQILASSRLPADRDWFVNGQGQTYSIIRGPLTFRMGSTPQVFPDLQPSEVDHARRIPRSYAVAGREVTMREYGRFLDAKPAGVIDNRADPQYRTLSADCAAGGMTWFEATRYCNWLSAAEGIPESQWCYPKEFGPGSNLPADFLERTGYRLPTEAEWENACRAGTTSAYPFGQAVGWLANYAWFERQSGITMKRVAQLKPNDLGLFDVLGNAYEWLNDPHEPYPLDPAGKPVVDVLRNPSCQEDLVRVIRGGAYPLASASNRSAFRSYGIKPSFRYPYIGFRPARTLP